MVYTIDGNTNVTRRKKIILQGGSSGAQTDYQLKLAATYAAAMQSDFDDLRFVKADMQTLIDAWLEDKSDGSSADVWAEFPTTPANGVTQDYWMYYGNAGVASDWDGAATFLQYHGATSTGYKESNAVTQPFVYEAKIKRNTDGVNYIQWGMGINNMQGGDSICMLTYSPSNQIIFRTYNNGANTDDSTTPDLTYDTWYNIKITEASLSSGVLSIDTYADFSVASNLPDAAMGMLFSLQNGLAEQDWSFVHKYAANPPTYAFGSEEHQRRTPQFM